MHYRSLVSALQIISSTETNPSPSTECHQCLATNSTHGCYTCRGRCNSLQRVLSRSLHNGEKPCRRYTNALDRIPRRLWRVETRRRRPRFLLGAICCSIHCFFSRCYLSFLLAGPIFRILLFVALSLGTSWRSAEWVCAVHVYVGGNLSFLVLIGHQRANV